MSEVLPSVSKRSNARVWGLWFGLAGGPAAWFAQLMLGYFLWARDCFPGDQPAAGGAETALRTAMFGFDGLAMLVGFAALAVSSTLWRATPKNSSDHFMALWGVLSSICFLAAILFATIISVEVSSCG